MTNLTLEEINNYIQKPSYLRLASIKSSDIASISVGDTLYFGSSNSFDLELKPIKVTSIASSGLIKTDSGLNFSTKNYYLLSTKELASGTKAYLFDLDSCSAQIEKQLKSKIDAENQKTLWNIKYKVDALTLADSDLIAKLAKLLSV